MFKLEEEIKTLATSSIGPMWPPVESSFGRVKGFYNERIIDTQDELSDVIDVFNLASRDGLEDPNFRISVRMLVKNVVLNSSLPILNTIGEAVIPLAGTRPILKDSSILYIGINGRERQPNKGDIEKAMENYQQALSRKFIPARQMVERVKQQGYELQALLPSQRNGDRQLFEQLCGLYERFGWNRVDVAELVANNNNIIAIAIADEGVVSSGVAEMSVINFKRDPNLALRIIELTEASTLSSHGGKGLYQAVSALLLMELNKLSLQGEVLGGEVDLAYGECNGTSQAVLNVVKSQGRTFAAEVSASLNLPFLGILPQHVPIEGDTRIAKYNDLFPAYLTRQAITTFVEG